MTYQFITLGKLPPHPTPPSTLAPFIWHFLSQIKGFLLILVVLEGLAGVLQASIPLMLGWLVTALSSGKSPTEVIHEPWLRTLGAPTLVTLGLCSVTLWYLYDHHYTNRFNNLIRYQLGRYTLGHSLSYFQNDFAGRIANKVLEGGPTLRDPVRSAIGAVWYAMVFSTTCLGLMLTNNLWLATPALVWLGGYVLSLWYFVPKVKALSLIHSRQHTRLVGQVNDTYTNITSVKLFGRETYEEDRLLGILSDHSSTLRASHHVVWLMGTVQTALNILLLLTTTAMALGLWQAGRIPAGVVIMSLPMVWQMVNQSGWIRGEVTRIFEELSRVEECMETIAKPYTVVDAPAAQPLVVRPRGGTVTFDHVDFHYGKGEANGKGVVRNLSLTIPAGQRVGIVGRSGAGKSTLMNLLLRFYDVEKGRITIDDQDIGRVTQASLRNHIAMVTQDSSLLHRSLADNIRYGRPDATDAEVEDAARRAHAHDFILTLQDKQGRTGYEAHVGERGVKLSGGQRQRIAIARVILENAPILLLDEATSALDSEVEAAIQQEMQTLMDGKTTLAIAHRLSTIMQMDRLVVMDKGRIVEDGTHAELLAKGGLYASLWERQSGGFLADT